MTRRALYRAYGLLTAIVLLAGIYYAYSFVQTSPTWEFSLNNSWQIASLSPCAPDAPDCEISKLRLGDRVLRIGSLSYQDFATDRSLAVGSDYKPGDRIAVTYERDGQISTIEVTLKPANLEEQLRLLVGFLPMLAFWLAGAAAWAMLRTWDARWHTFIWFNFLMALWLTTGSVNALRVGYSEIIYRVVSWPLAAVILHFHAITPTPVLKAPRWAWWLLYGLAAALTVAEFGQMVDISPAIFVAISLVLSLGILLRRLLQPEPSGRVAARFMLAGIGLAFLPGIVTSLPEILGITIPSASTIYIVLVATLLLPLTYTYAVFKRELGGLEFRFNRFIIWYAFVVLYVAVGAVVTQFLLAWVAPQEQVTLADLWILAGLFTAAFLTWPLFNRWLSRLALGVSYNPIQIGRLVAAELPAVSRSEQIAQLLAHRVMPSLSIRQSALYTVFDGAVQPVYVQGFEVPPAVSPRDLERWLAVGDRYRPPSTDLPGQPDWLRLALPLTHQGQQIGVWVFGRRDPDDFYTEGDIRLLKQIASQLALALENAHLYNELKQSEAALALERASLAERVEEQTAELRAKNEALARALTAKDAFVASMSHELRTPLNAILGLSEALQDGVYGPVNDQQVRQLAGIEASGQHLLSLINDILDAAKLQHGTLTLVVGEVAVEGLCRDSLQFVQERARRKGIHLQLDIDPQVKCVHADPRRLKQILINLLHNAVKFTPEGGQAGLMVTGHPETNTLHFTVWDTGVGIAHEDQARLFQPFVQLDAGLDRRFEGTGLGLMLVRQLAQLHGGDVTVISELGQGSRFTVSLPWQPSETITQSLPLNGAATT